MRVIGSQFISTRLRAVFLARRLVPQQRRAMILLLLWILQRVHASPVGRARSQS